MDVDYALALVDLTGTLLGSALALMLTALWMRSQRRG